MGNATDQIVTILTYNTHLYWKSHTPGNVYYEDEIRFNKIVSKLEGMSFDVDFVGLQEVWSDDVKNMFINKLSIVYPYHYYQPHSAKFAGPGLLLLSKHPLQLETYTAFSDLVFPDSLSQKGILSMVATLHGTKLGLAITHMQAGDDDSNVIARESNFEQLVSVVSHMPSQSFVILGDFNVMAEYSAGSQSHEYRVRLYQMHPLDVVDVFRTVYPNTKQDHGYTSDGVNNSLVRIFHETDYAVRQRLDYVFAKQNTLVPCGAEVVTDWIYNDNGHWMDFSDHYPLKVSLQIGE